MSKRQAIYHSLLKLPLSIMIKSNLIPSDPIKDLNIDISRPIIYALPFQSTIDLLTLQKRMLELGLPDPLSPIEINGKTYSRYVFTSVGPKLFSNNNDLPKDSLRLFKAILQHHSNHTDIDFQLIPVSILWGRKPGKEGTTNPHLMPLNTPQKLVTLIISGRDSTVRISPMVSLRYMADNHGADEAIAYKLARVAKIHFSRQKLAASGPNLPNRQMLFNRLLQSEAIENIIIEEANTRNEDVEKIRKEARNIMEEIATNFSYSLIKKSNYVLTWLWNRLYQGLNINNASAVRKLAQEGHEIVYVPCHRSHMDYLLLSYVLYHEGLVPPHIAAGINLNFFPAGPIFRRLGAFFIRRSFKDNRLYSTIFREYLAELFSKGYSVEYFSEGGRSRTGRLLTAKTGMLAMTIQAMLRGLNRPVTLVPVYIGYEHVMEVTTYAKELRGKKKEKENAGQVLRTLRKLRNFGLGYVNFGEPISLNHYLNEHAENWSDSINSIHPQKPNWMKPVVNGVANKMMTHINSAAAANALTLCATALLAARQRALSKEDLTIQLVSYLRLLRNVPYSNTSTVPDKSAEELLEHAIKLDKFIIEKDALGEIISLDRNQSILMTYYRNNIIHMFALPSLIATLVIKYRHISLTKIQQQIKSIYPFLKAELFLHYETMQLNNIIESHVNELLNQNLIKQENEQLTLNTEHIFKLDLLSSTISETLQRYAIALTNLQTYPELNREMLEERSQIMAQRLSRLHGINAPEFFDKGVFGILFNTLKEEGYINADGVTIMDKVSSFSSEILALLSPEIKLTIESVKNK